MMQAFAEEDVIRVLESRVREKISKYLISIPNSVSVSALSNAIDEKSSNVNYHSDELGKPNHNLIEVIKTGRKYVKITEKGNLVWQEVERRNVALVAKILIKED